MKHFTNQKIIKTLVLIVSVFSLVLLVRGVPGNPSSTEIEHFLNGQGQVFETSQERSRWALLLSLYNEKSVAIDSYASMGTPDIGFINGHYYSFFPPLMSILAIPFYWIGTLINSTTISVFTLPILFSIATMYLLYKFAMKLELGWKVSMLTAIGFGFGTSALAYSVTIFAHIASAFFILLGVYVATFKLDRSRLWSWSIWLLYAILLFLDFPNGFLFLPVAFYTLYKSLNITDDKNTVSIGIDWKKFAGVVLIIAAAGVYGYYNYVNFGSPTKLSNTIPRVRDLKVVEESIPEGAPNDGQALHTRSLLNGVYTFTVSPDRGLIWYSPILLLFVLGLGKSNKKDFETIALSISFICLVLYSMFGDPYGGWAFGSRYMVAVMPLLMLLVGVGFRNNKSNLKKVLYSITLLYSSAIVLCAALTTNVLPPKIEAEPLGLEYTGSVNWNMLWDNKLNPYVYNYVLDGGLSGIEYFLVLYIPLSILFIYLIWSEKDYED